MLGLTVSQSNDFQEKAFANFSDNRLGRTAYLFLPKKGGLFAGHEACRS